MSDVQNRRGKSDSVPPRYLANLPALVRSLRELEGRRLTYADLGAIRRERKRPVPPEARQEETPPDDASVVPSGSRLRLFLSRPRSTAPLLDSDAHPPPAAEEEVPGAYRSSPQNNGPTSCERAVADDHNTPPEVPELMAPPEVPVLTMISPRTSRQIERMEAVRALINSRVEEDSDDNDGRRISDLPKGTSPYEIFPRNFRDEDCLQTLLAESERKGHLPDVSRRRVAARIDHSNSGRRSASERRGKCRRSHSYPEEGVDGLNPADLRLRRRDRSNPGRGVCSDRNYVTAETLLLPNGSWSKQEENPRVRFCRVLLRAGKSSMVLFAWKVWVHAAERIRYEDRSEASTSIQLACRQYLAREELSARKELHGAQLRLRAEAKAEERRAERSAATLLQKMCRSAIQRRKYLEARKCRTGAEMIQRALRCVRARKALLIRQERRYLEIDSAAVIQGAVRSWFACRQATLLRKVRTVTLKRDAIRAEFQRGISLKSSLVKCGSAYVIQCAWRRFFTEIKNRHEHELRIRLKRTSGAIAIQKMARLFLARQYFLRRLGENAKENERQQGAAVRIQNTFRCYLARRYRRYLKYEYRKAHLIRHMEKQAYLKPRVFKMLRIRRKVKRDNEEVWEDKFLLELNIQQSKHRIRTFLSTLGTNRAKLQDKSAVKLQAAFRSYCARKRMLLYRRCCSIKSNASDSANLSAAEKAAIFWQKCFRGNRERTRLKEIRINERALAIQKYFRGHVCRQQINCLRQEINAGQIIHEYVFRFHKNRSESQNIKHAREWNKQAVIIQAQARKFLALIFFQSRLQEVRRKSGEKLAAKMNLEFCLERSMSLLLLNSTRQPARYRDGIMQAMFNHWASSANKMDNFALVKMLKEVPDLFKGRVQKEEFGMTNLNLLLAKKSRGSKHVTFRQFIEILDIMSENIFKTVQNCRGHSGRDGRMLMLIFYHVFLSISGKFFHQLLQKKARSFLCKKTIVIQCLFRRIWSQEERQRLEAKQRKHREKIVLGLSCTKIQCCGRRYLSRKIAISLAQESYSKFLDPTAGKPYYSFAGVVSWEKPKIFGNAVDCEKVLQLPQRGQEYTVICAHCQKHLAALNCLSCHESLCKDCYLTSHAKGMRREGHFVTAIPVCVQCGFQHSSRLCFVCTSKSAKVCSFCDTCYHSTHNGHRENHCAPWLILPCVECNKLAASWRCEDACKDVFCSICFHNVHKHGARRFHHNERLGYHTKEMEKFREHCTKKRFRVQRHIMRQVAEKFQKRQHQVKSVVKIQSHWRGWKGRRAGQIFIKHMRWQQREAWRRRKEEESVQKRRQWNFREVVQLLLKTVLHTILRGSLIYGGLSP